jgi:hypothetical protein
MVTDKREQAARLVRMAIHAVAREAFGSRVVKHPVPELSSVARDVEPLPGLRAAVLARDIATSCVRDYAHQARAEGHSWDVIAAILGLECTDEPASRGERAYLHVVAGRELRTDDPRQHWGSLPSAHWRCTACDQYVTDHGPFDADPVSNEEGHAPECAHHAAEIAAYRAEWGDEE